MALFFFSFGVKLDACRVKDPPSLHMSLVTARCLGPKLQVTVPLAYLPKVPRCYSTRAVPRVLYQLRHIPIKL